MVNEIDFVKITTRRGRTQFVQKVHQKSPRKKRTQPLRPSAPILPLPAASHTPEYPDDPGDVPPSMGPYPTTRRRGKVSCIHWSLHFLPTHSCRRKMNTFPNGNCCKNNTFSNYFSGRCLLRHHCVQFVKRRRPISDVKIALEKTCFAVDAVSNIIATRPFIVFAVGTRIISRRLHSVTWACCFI
jgi:hypothetical protein